MEILFDLRHTARCCSRLLTLWNDFSVSSAQTAPPTSWSTDESGRETASTLENLPAAAVSWELGVSRDLVSSYSSLETSGQASCRLWFFFFFCSAFFWVRMYITGQIQIWKILNFLSFCSQCARCVKPVRSKAPQYMRKIYKCLRLPTYFYMYCFPKTSSFQLYLLYWLLLVYKNYLLTNYIQFCAENDSLQSNIIWVWPARKVQFVLIQTWNFSSILNHQNCHLQAFYKEPTVT